MGKTSPAQENHRLNSGHQKVSAHILPQSSKHPSQDNKGSRPAILQGGAYTLVLAMGIAFDQAPGRPDHIEAILNGLDRYNPETTTVFQDYVTAQCEERTYDCYANLALLKL